MCVPTVFGLMTSAGRRRDARSVGVLGSGALGNVVAGVRERDRHELPQARIVVDDENRPGHSPHPLAG
jgi:hypothetical protein